MGTRSLTYVFDTDGSAVVCMYRQFDGYLAGHGKELADFLNGFEIVNGYGSAMPKLANGMGCLAAQLVSHFKVGTGGFYLEVPKLGNDFGQEYEYHVYQDKIVVYTDYSERKTVFTGTWTEFVELCLTPETVEE